MAELLEVGPWRRGASIGRYLVLAHLGAGAMGVVLAAHDPELDRKVAIKVLHPSSSSPTDGHARLQREAQALAKLAHPNVVAVHDVGIHEGRLFLAMEFVAGRTLAAWLRERPREPAEIVSIFAAAGRGLAAAHEAGLVHRDFKPDNVMIADDGRVRVMDFGLARGLEASEPAPALARLHDETLDDLTRTGALLGTPAYMAPEQLDGKRADASCDQFAFCVALYEALFDQHPFPARTLIELLGAHLKGPIVAPARAGQVPSWLRKVVLRGLERDAERRFPSMQALLDALADDPALGRRRVVLRLGTLALVAALALSLFVIMQREDEACRDMAAPLVGVWDDEARSDLEAAFLASGVGHAPETWSRSAAAIDAYAEAWVAARESACMASQRGEQSGELLDRRMACLDTRLVALSAVLSVFSEADGEIVGKALGMLEALPSIERCSDPEVLAAARPPLDDPRLAALAAQIGERLAEVAALRDAGKYQRARELAEPLVGEADTLPDALLAARARMQLGRVLSELGEYDQASSLLEQAYASALAELDPELASEAATTLVVVRGFHQAHPEDGRGWALHAEALARASGSSLARAHVLTGVASIARAEGRYDEARDVQQRAIELFEADSPEHPALPTALDNLGIIATLAGDHDAARNHYERALALLEARRGPTHPDVAQVLDHLGNLTELRGEFTRARELHERALDIRTQALGPTHPDVAATLQNLAVVLEKQGELTLARSHLERALAIVEAKLGPHHPTAAMIHSNLGNLAESEGKLAEARVHHERATAILEVELGPEHPTLGIVRDNLGVLLYRSGEVEAAREQHQRALDIFTAHFGPDHLELATTLQNLAVTEQRLGQTALARSHFERALTIWSKALGPDHLDVGYAAVGLGLSLLDAEPRDLPGALALLERALAIRSAGEASPSSLADTRFALARALWDAAPEHGRDRSRARALAEAAQATYAELGSDPPELAKITDWLATHTL